MKIQRAKQNKVLKNQFTNQQEVNCYSRDGVMYGDFNSLVNESFIDLVLHTSNIYRLRGKHV